MKLINKNRKVKFNIDKKNAHTLKGQKIASIEFIILGMCIAKRLTKKENTI